MRIERVFPLEISKSQRGIAPDAKRPNRKPAKSTGGFSSIPSPEETKTQVQDTPWEKGLDEHLRFSAGILAGLLPKRANQE